MPQLPADASPTKLRHVVVSVCVLMSLLLYLDRICVSIAGDFIKEDLALTEVQYDWFLSAFFWTYALGQVPAGWLSDRFGARFMLTAYILSWSLFTAAIGLVHGVTVLLVMRFAFGFAQAGAYPTSGGLLSKWIPFSTRGTASSFVVFGGRTGGAAAPYLTAFLMALLVPTTVSSLVRERELLNVPRFCSQLATAQNSEHFTKLRERSRAKAAAMVARRVWDLLPGETRQSVDRISKAQSALPKGVDAEVSAGDRESLIQSVNEIIRRTDFSEPEFCNPEFTGQLGLAREALRIADAPAADRQPAQVERLNRLILEAAFSKEVGKIYVHGWRPVMWVYGAAGSFVAVLFWLLLRNRPEEHPLCNPAELALIRSDLPEGMASSQGQAIPFPWRALLSSRSMWLMSISQLGTNVGWVFLVTKLPQYLDEVHQVSLDQRGLMQSVILCVGMGGMLLGGWLTDALTRLLGLRWGRGIPLAAPKVFCVGAYLVCLGLDAPWQIAASLALVAFFTDLGIGASWAYMQDVGGQYVGSMLGWANMFGNFGAAIAPLLYGLALGKDANWNAVFLVCAGAFLVSGVTALGIDSRIPIGGATAKDPTR